MPTNAAPEDTFRNIVLDADSRLAVGGNFVMGDGTGTAGQLDLGGHVLTASVAGKKVMAWESGSRPAGVLFTRAEGGSHGVAAQDDGVYAISGGIMVIVR